MPVTLHVLPTVYAPSHAKNAGKAKGNRRVSGQVISSFAKTIDLKDHYTCGYSARVAQYSRQLAEAMGWSKERVDNLYRVAMLHDVGKVVIPDEILNKRGPLTDEEYAKMKEHADIGNAILEEISRFPMIAVGAKSHHERFDGKVKITTCDENI